MEEKEKSWKDPRSGVRTGLGLGFEVAANTGLDAFSFVPGSQQAGSAFINYLAQRIRGGKVSKGEMLAAAATSQIPGLTQAKALTRGGRLARSVAKGGISGGVTTTSMSLVDEGELPSFGEFATGVTGGGLLGGAFDLAPAAVTGKLGKEVDDIKYDSSVFLRQLKSRITGGPRIDHPDVSFARYGSSFADDGTVAAAQRRIDATDLPDADETAARTEMYLTRDIDNLIAKDLPKGAGFNTDNVKDYARLAYTHRKNRIVAGGKQNLMKDFDQVLTNNSGQEFIFVRRAKLRNQTDPAAIENYKLTSVDAQRRKLIRSLGFDKQIPEDVKALKIIVKELNKLEQQNPKLFLSSLMEYGDRAYLEHKVARSQFEDFWARVEARNQEDIDNNLFQWTGARGRNTAENLRLLFDPNYKKLKDATETRFINSKLYKSAKGRQSQPDDIVITIEDPGSTTFGANNMFVRSNPGNIQFRKAGTGEVVGAIPDYYRQLYSTAFKKGYERNYGFLANPNNPAVPPKFRARAGESVDDYIERVINERIDEAMSGNFDMQNFEANYLNEIAQFYDLFHDKLGWVRLPSWANDIITGKVKFADRLQAEIDDFEIENAPRSPVVKPKTLKQSNLDEALQEIRDLEADIRNLERDPAKLPKETQGYNPNTRVIDRKTGVTTGTNYGPVQSNLRKLKRELQERIDAIKAEYGIDQGEDFTQQSLDFDE
tara:strand:- start:51 stop:2192 length:2142 start_codon:yes stop_codon:yes gene_type:complete